MAKEYAQAFYHSQAWKNTRDAYYKLQRGMCERCTKELAEGIMFRNAEEFFRKNL